MLCASYFYLINLKFMIFQTLLLLFTAISVRRQVISSKKRLGKSSGKSSEDLLTKEEVAAFKTVSLMQLGFTITLGN